MAWVTSPIWPLTPKFMTLTLPSIPTSLASLFTSCDGLMYEYPIRQCLQSLTHFSWYQYISLKNFSNPNTVEHYWRPPKNWFYKCQKLKTTHVVIYCRWKKNLSFKCKTSNRLWTLHMLTISATSCFHVICREGRDEYNWRCFVGEVIDLSYVVVIRYHPYISQFIECHHTSQLIQLQTISHNVIYVKFYHCNHQ